MPTLSKPILDVYQGNPVSPTYKPKASEVTTLHTEIFDRTVNDTPIVVLFLGTSILVGQAAADGGDHTIESEVYFWDTDMDPATVVAGTAWVTPEFGSAPFNIGTAPYSNSFALHACNQLKRRYNRPVYGLIIGKGGTVIEAWIKAATLSANGWSRGAAQDMTAIMYPGIANALAQVPGAPTSVDYVFLSHGAANEEERPEIVAAKAVAVMTDLGSLVDLTQTPIVQHEQCHSDGAEYRVRHLSMLYAMQEYLPTMRIARTIGLEPHTPGNVHFSGDSLVQLGHRMEAESRLPPTRVDYRVEPLGLGRDDGFRFFTNNSERAEFDMVNRTIHLALNPTTMVDDATLGWCYETSANAATVLWTRRIFEVPQNALATIAIHALAPDVGATVDINLSIHTWDIDGVSLGDTDVTPSNSPFTTAMGAAVVSSTFGVAGVLADGLIPATAAYIAFGISLGIGANDERLRFIIKDISMAAQAPVGGLRSYTVAGVPAAATYPRQTIYISNESGGAVPAFSDGTNWRRVTDRAIIS